MNIYKNVRYAAMGAVICAAICTTACSDTEDIDQYPASFELVDSKGDPVSDVQHFAFDNPITYKINSTNVLSAPGTGPQGWTVESDLRTKECVITPPELEDIDAVSSGQIVFDVKSSTGRNSQYTISVVAAEMPMEFGFDVPIETLQMLYNQTLPFDFSATASFDDIEFSVPKDWGASYTKGERAFKLSAPASDAVNPAMSGSVSVTPISFRGEKGTPITFNVELLEVGLPHLVFDDTEARFKFGTPKTISITEAKDVGKVIATAPEGWEVSVANDFTNFVVTPPATLGDAAAHSGKVSLKVYNILELEDYMVNYELDVRFDGIADLTDLAAFRDTYLKLFKNTEGVTEADLGKYMQNNEIVLLDDIDNITDPFCLSGHNSNTEANFTVFSHVFNGLGHTMALNIETDSYKPAGLFQAVGPTGAVKNLKIDGKFKLVYAGTSTWGLGGGICAIAQAGSSFTDITSNLSLVYAPPATLDNTKRYNNDHTVGGLIGRVDGTGKLTITNCHTTGLMDMQTGCLRYLGGIIGTVNAGAGHDVKCELRNCSNSGDIKIYITGSDAMTQANKRIGGLIGNSQGVTNYAPTMLVENCSNTGDITIDSGGRNGRAYLGGIAGSSIGTFRNCTNSGNITTSNTAVSWDYVGGLIALVNGGKVGALVIENCKNIPSATDSSKKATISTGTHYTAGIVGVIDAVSSAVIKDCLNQGNISNGSPTGDALYIAGICGMSGGGSIENCVNEGDLSGYVSAAAAGIVARATSGSNAGTLAAPGIIKGCSNKGEIKTTTTLVDKASDAQGYLPLLAGIASIGMANDPIANSSGVCYKLEDCSNTGAITGQVTKEECAQNIWVSQAKHRADDPSLVDDSTNVIADSATKAAQADRSKISVTVKRP